MLSGKRLDLLSGRTWFIEIEIYTNSKGLTHKPIVMKNGARIWASEVPFLYWHV